jgi:hypothetical protein
MLGWVVIGALVVVWGFSVFQWCLAAWRGERPWENDGPFNQDGGGK